MNNPSFKHFLEDIYLERLVVSETSQWRNNVSYFDLLIDITNGELVGSIFDKRDKFDFHLVNLS